MPDNNILTVSELNAFIKDVLSAGFPASLWVCGEIQNLNNYKSKAHLYFDLVEKAPGGKDIKAKVQVKIWAGVRPKIEAILNKAENAFTLKDGIEVKFSGKVDFYAPYGTIGFIVDGIDPVYTLGKIAQDRQKLISELTQAGVLAKNKERILPMVPLRLGLITAFDSAAYNDFIDECKKSGFSFVIFPCNAVMQGKNCEASIAAALEQCNAIPGLDVIVITRGGGSLADLGAFDSKGIALAVAASRYAVITGIGHEINTSVTDLAAHTYAKTPTAAAHFLCERVRLALEKLQQCSDTLWDDVARFIQDCQQHLQQDALAFQSGVRTMVEVRKTGYARAFEKLRQLPVRVMERQQQDIRSLEGLLRKSSGLRLRDARTKIEHIQKIAELSSPERVYRRGFSVTRGSNGKVLRSVQALAVGETVMTQLYKGVFNATVMNTQEKAPTGD